eukprot:scaffold2605_cov28-Attheya_sp.AAC.1
MLADAERPLGIEGKCHKLNQKYVETYTRVYHEQQSDHRNGWSGSYRRQCRRWQRKWEQADNGKKGTKKTKQGGVNATAAQNNLKAAGTKQIQTREIAVTTVMLEFNIASGTSQVNPRPKHIEFCKLIQAIDPEMAIESAINTTTWNSPNELPLAKEYQQHFNVQDRNPPYKIEGNCGAFHHENQIPRQLPQARAYHHEVTQSKQHVVCP